jgi:hypothetical protein
MAKANVFDGLVGELSAGERRELLDRVRRSSGVSLEPLFSKESLPSAKPPERASRLAQKSLLERVVLFFRKIFSGRDIDSLLDEDELKALARRVDQQFPGLVDYRQNLVLEPFLGEIQRLRDAARFFYDVLQRGFDNDKAAFFGFLGSFELPETHTRLLSEADPFAFAALHPEASDTEVREAVLAIYDECFASLLEERRRKMYQDLRCLLFLKRLSGFLFERVQNQFKPQEGQPPRRAATFSELRDLILELEDILFSFSSPPSVELMESLFAFAEHEAMERADDSAEALIRTDLTKAEMALSVIRSFNKRVPLPALAQLVSLDPRQCPQELPAGEDWLVVYKGFWKSRIEAKLDELKRERKYQRLTDEIRGFVGSGELVHYNYISRDERPESPAIHQDLALAFIDAFMRGTFAAEMNRPLKIVLMDGDFYRKENRLEFTDAYNSLSHASEAIAALDARLGPEGEIGGLWNQTRLEASSLPIKRRKMQSIARGAEDEAERIIRDVAGALTEIVLVIRGILKGEAGGRYDSLANLSFMDGKANKDFLKGLNGVKDRCEKAIVLLQELSGLDLMAERG